MHVPQVMPRDPTERRGARRGLDDPLPKPGRLVRASAGIGEDQVVWTDGPRTAAMTGQDGTGEGTERNRADTTRSLRRLELPPEDRLADVQGTSGQIDGAPPHGEQLAHTQPAQQAETGVSLAAQAEKIRAMAVVRDAELVDIVTDAGASAKDLNREGLARVLDLVDKRKVDVGIVAKLDRLTRSVRDLGELLERFERRGVSLVSVAESLDTGTAAGRLVLNVKASVSQWEREVIGERTREALAPKKAQGQRIGALSASWPPCGGSPCAGPVRSWASPRRRRNAGSRVSSGNRRPGTESSPAGYGMGLRNSIP